MVLSLKLLAIETATEACSAALLLEGASRERYEVAPRAHGRLILAMIEALLAEAGIELNQLDAIAFGRGPGAFTGVRIAVSVTQGLAFGADLPVVPISTLAALAQGAYRTTGAISVAAAIDARMEEVYWGLYRQGSGGIMELQGEESVVVPEGVIFTASASEACQWQGVGSGWGTYDGVLSGVIGGALRGITPGLSPHAQDVAVLAQQQFSDGLAVCATEALPLYLRNNVARKPLIRGLANAPK